MKYPVHPARTQINNYNTFITLLTPLLQFEQQSEQRLSKAVKEEVLTQ